MKPIYPVSKAKIKREIGRVRHAIETATLSTAPYWEGWLIALNTAILNKDISSDKDFLKMLELEQSGTDQEQLKARGARDGLSFCVIKRNRGRQAIEGVWLGRIKVSKNISDSFDKILKEKPDPLIRNIPDLRRKAYKEFIIKTLSLPKPQ